MKINIKKEIDYVLDRFISTFFEPKNEETDAFFKKAYLKLYDDGYKIKLIGINRTFEMINNGEKIKDEKKLFYIYDDLEYSVYYSCVFDYFNFKFNNLIFSHYLIIELIKYLKIEDKHLLNVFVLEKDKYMLFMIYNCYFSKCADGRLHDAFIKNKVSINDIKEAITPFIDNNINFVAILLYFKIKFKILIDKFIFRKSKLSKINNFVENIVEKIESNVEVIYQNKKSINEGYYMKEECKIYINQAEHAFAVLIHEFIHYIQYNYFDMKGKDDLEVELPAIIGTYIILKNYYPGYTKNSFSTTYLFRVMKCRCDNTLNLEKLRKIIYDSIPVIKKTLEVLELN